MDMTAFDLCYQYGLPIRVFDMNVPENLLKIAEGENTGTLVS